MDITSLTSVAQQTGINPVLLIALVLWSLVWKGLALWRAASLRQKNWFIAILILNTLGLFEIFYIYFIAKKYKVEVIEN